MRNAETAGLVVADFHIGDGVGRDTDTHLDTPLS
jgi:hypothetical protein